MSPWLIVTGGWPAVLAAAASWVARAGVYLVPVAVTAAAALTFGCGSLLRRHLDHRPARATVPPN